MVADKTVTLIIIMQHGKGYCAGVGWAGVWSVQLCSLIFGMVLREGGSKSALVFGVRLWKGTGRLDA